MNKIFGEATHCRKLTAVWRMFAILMMLCVLLLLGMDRASAHNAVGHHWMIQRAINYLAEKQPALFARYPLYSYIPWLIEGSDYADSAGRNCRWKQATFDTSWPVEMCDTIHHYGGLKDLVISVAGVDHAVAHPGQFAALEYAPELFRQAVVFWPGGQAPNLSALTKVDSGRTGVVYLTTPLGATWMGAEPYCEVGFPGHPDQCPRWPDWAWWLPTEAHPDESVKAAMIYMGWSIHMIEDLTNCGHATNTVYQTGGDRCHGDDENDAGKYIADGTFGHLPVQPGSQYKYSSEAVVDNIFPSTCTCSGVTCPCEVALPMDAKGYGAMKWESGDRKGLLEKQVDAGIKLVAGYVYAYLNALPLPSFSTSWYYYLKTKDLLQVKPNGRNDGALVNADRKGQRIENEDEYAFRFESAGDYYYLFHRNSGKYVYYPGDNPGGKFRLMGPIPAGQESRFKFSLERTPDGEYYLHHLYSHTYVCVDMSETNPADGSSPFETCLPPPSGKESNYRFNLLMAPEMAPPSQEIRSLVNLPPGLVFGLAHSYHNLDPQGMRRTGVGFLQIDRPWLKHGGDLGAETSEGFYWWMMPDKADLNPAQSKIPPGVVFALKHSENQGNDSAIAVFGLDPAKPASPQLFPGFIKYHGGDLGAGGGTGYSWYESTGLNFDWAIDRVWADRLPRGTVIGLKHSVNQPNKKLAWDGVQYDPTDYNQDPPPGYARRGNYDENASEGQGFGWYEKITGVTINLNSEQIPVWPRPGVLGDGLEKNSTRPGSAYSSFRIDTADPRVCQADCYNDSKCKGWVFDYPTSGTGPWCHLKDTTADPQTSLSVSGIKMGQ